MDMTDPTLNLYIGIVIGLFGGVGLAYLVLWNTRRQSRLVQQHIEKHQLELGESASLYLISKQLTIIFDQSDVIISDMKQATPERINYTDIESVKTEWQKRTEMHQLTMKLKSGTVYSHRIMQVYHLNFSDKQAASKKNATIVTGVIRQRLEAAGVAVELLVK